MPSLAQTIRARATGFASDFRTGAQHPPLTAEGTPGGPVSVHRAAPYHPPEIPRGRSIFPRVGSTNSNSPSYGAGNPASLVGNFGRTRAANLGSGPANPFDLLGRRTVQAPPSRGTPSLPRAVAAPTAAPSNNALSRVKQPLRHRLIQ